MRRLPATTLLAALPVFTCTADDFAVQSCQKECVLFQLLSRSDFSTIPCSPNPRLLWMERGIHVQRVEMEILMMVGRW